MVRWLVLFVVSAACSQASSSGTPAVTLPTHDPSATTVDPDAAATTRIRRCQGIRCFTIRRFVGVIMWRTVTAPP